MAGVLEGNSPPTDWHGVVIISGSSAPSLPQFLSRRGSFRPPVVKIATYHPVRPRQRGCITSLSLRPEQPQPANHFKLQPTIPLRGEAQGSSVGHFFEKCVLWSPTPQNLSPVQRFWCPSAACCVENPHLFSLCKLAINMEMIQPSQCYNFLF